jgi:hypothetical protein
VSPGHRRSISAAAVLSLALGFGSLGAGRAVAAVRGESTPRSSPSGHLTLPIDDLTSVISVEPGRTVVQALDKRPRAPRQVAAGVGGWPVLVTLSFLTRGDRTRTSRRNAPVLARGYVPRAPPMSLHF